MKITIDTKEDSHEEIKKVISLLKHLVGEGKGIYMNEPEHNTDIFSDNASSSKESGKGSNGGLFSMFGDTGSSRNEAKEVISNKVLEEEKEEEIEIVPYE